MNYSCKLWSDKYYDYVVNTDIIENLKNININVVLVGREHVGKKYIVEQYLKHYLECNEIKMNMQWENREFVVDNIKKTTINLMVRESSHHFELFMKDCGVVERYIIRSVIKPIVKTVVFDYNLVPIQKKIVIYNVHHFSSLSMKMLKALCEKYNGFICTSKKFFDDSVMIPMIIPLVSKEKMKIYLTHIKEQENLNHNEKYLQESLKEYDSIDECVCNFQFKHENVKNNLDELLEVITKAIVTKQPVVKVREIIYILLVNNIEPSYILKKIISKITKIKKISSNRILCHNIIKKAAEVNHKMTDCERHIYHIEHFANYVIYLLNNETTLLKNKKDKMTE
jgi:hypothetical protein